MHIEPSLCLIDDLLGSDNYGLYHISSRNKVADFNSIKNGDNVVLENVTDVLKANSDVLDMAGNFLLGKDECSLNQISDRPFYSIFGFVIFKDVLEYKLFMLSQYKDFIYKEPITNDDTPYYPEYFSDIFQFSDEATVIRSIIRRHINNIPSEDIFGKIIHIINTILQGVNFKLFNRSHIYRVSGESYHVMIEDLGNIFELRYRDLLMKHKRIIP